MFYTILAACFFTTGYLLYSRKEIIKDAGQVSSNYVDLIHEHEHMRRAAKIVLDDNERLKKDNNSLGQLVDEQYEIIQTYDNEVEKLKKANVVLASSLKKSERLRVN
jgi:regulator of replication initiation timing